MRITHFGTFEFALASGYIVSESDDSDTMNTNLIQIAGVSGALDAYGTGRSPKPPRLFKVNLFLDPSVASTTPDAMLDTLLAAMYSGQQQITVIMHNGTSRYGLGKCISFSRRHQYGHTKHMALELTFEMAQPYWFGAETQQVINPVTATPTAMDLTNTGTDPLVKVQMIFVGTAKSPSFVNHTNGYIVRHSGDISVAAWLVDTNTGVIQLNGIDDYANCYLNFPATQIGLFRYEVGANDVDFIAYGGGTPSGVIQVTYRFMYH